jgi:hypothetical protein
LLPWFDSLKISVFGVSLGAEVVSDNDRLNWEAVVCDARTIAIPQTEVDPQARAMVFYLEHQSANCDGLAVVKLGLVFSG